jgi:hypothetical protein
MIWVGSRFLLVRYSNMLIQKIDRTHFVTLLNSEFSNKIYFNDQSSEKIQKPHGVFAGGLVVNTSQLNTYFGTVGRPSDFSRSSMDCRSVTGS